MIPLSPQQRRLAALIVQGLSTKQLAREMGLAIGTVRCHQEKLMMKIGARNRTHAAALIARMGLDGEREAA